MRMIGVTAADSVPCSTIRRRFSMYWRELRRSLMSYGLCSASKMVPWYGAVESAAALSMVGGVTTVTGILPCSSARMMVFSAASPS
jgi:hypothetical protein